MLFIHFISLSFVLDIAATITPSDNHNLNKLKAQRQNLVREMTSAGNRLELARIRKNNLNTELLLDHLDRILWPKIVEVSIAIFDSLSTDDEIKNEIKYQEELRKDVAAIRFYSKARHCKSPDETFYPLWKRCVAYQGRRVANPCPRNQQLFDGPDNVGVCDCQKSVNGTFVVYSSNTKQCHALHTQGPCRRGQWWVIKTRFPECQPVPKGCPADGRHVYWSPSKIMAKKCWRLKTRGPCPQARLLVYDETNNLISCQQASPVILPNIAVAPNRYRPPLRRSNDWCPRGSYRDRTYKCKSSF